jgi:hypothetical protein
MIRLRLIKLWYLIYYYNYIITTAKSSPLINITNKNLNWEKHQLSKWLFPDC